MRCSFQFILIAVVALFTASHAFLGTPSLAQAAEAEHRSYLRIGAGTKAQPVRLGLNKSMIIDIPREVRDVMVSNPQKIDAVMQSATRAYLIGKESGEANVIFLDKDGNQIATLEASVERDLSQLDDLLTRLIPGSRFTSMQLAIGPCLRAVYRNPIDASRACEIVTAFLGPLDQQNASIPTGAGPGWVSRRRQHGKRQWQRLRWKWR